MILYIEGIPYLDFFWYKYLYWCVRCSANETRSLV